MGYLGALIQIVVGVVDGIASCIGLAGDVARGIVGIDVTIPQGIDHRRAPIDSIVLVARGVATLIGGAGHATGGIIGIGHLGTIGVHGVDDPIQGIIRVGG